MPCLGDEPVTGDAAREPDVGARSAEALGRPSAGARDVERWVVDPERLRSIFYTGPPVEDVSELFEVRMILDGAAWTVPTHLLVDREALRVVPYHNADDGSDANGDPFGPGDAAVAELFPPGDVGFAIKHHRAAQRVQDLPYRSMYLLREELKLQDSHLQIVVGVERDGRPGAMTLSAPQTYEGGRFGTASYPMLFVRPVFPEELDAAQVRAFRDNLRTMAVGFSSVASFPSTYGSGDPLAASTPETLREHVAMMVRAIGGESSAVRWFQDASRRLYCGELGLVAANAALLVPLNARTMVPLVGEEAWEAFVEQVARHERGETSRFSSLNQNRLVPWIDVTTAPEDLLPISAYLEGGEGDAAKGERGPFAFEPQSAADLLRVYLRVVLPAMDGARAVAGWSGGVGSESAEVDVPALRGELIRSLEDGFVEILGLDKRGVADADRRMVETSMERLAVAAAEEGGGAEAMARLEPILDRLRDHLMTLDPPAGALLAPPSLFQAVAQGLWPAGWLDLEYVGHGLHVSLLRPEGEEE